MENQKEYRAELCASTVDPSFIFKLNIKYTSEEDGSGTIQIEWDETDADLQWWTNLGEELQKQFMIDALTAAIEKALPDEDFNYES